MYEDEHLEAQHEAQYELFDDPSHQDDECEECGELFNDCICPCDECGWVGEDCECEC